MNPNNRIILAQKSLQGLSIGDAFGESFFGEREQMLNHIDNRQIPPTQWEFTDDTVMAIAIFEQLQKHQGIHQDELAQAFADNHQKDVNRGYGSTVRMILREISKGGDWRILAQEVFSGMGSMGNGAAMRVSPIGAYHFDNLEKVKDLCIQSAEITHTHIEAITGAIAVGIATALATQNTWKEQDTTPTQFIKKVLEYLPDSDTKAKINKSLSVPYHYHIETVRAILGDGTKIIAQDTVPFALWCAAHNLQNYEEALWKAVSILGDRDTICAIVGGITAMSAPKTIPSKWIEQVESFDDWL